MVTIKGHGRRASLDKILHTRSPSSSANWRSRTMLFMDALELDLVVRALPHGGENIPDLMPSSPHRELAKAYTAFCSHSKGTIQTPYSFATSGNWGCGAFGGNKQVKAIIQWCAASMANVPELRYVLGGAEQKRFGKELSRFVGQVAEYTGKALEPRDLFNALTRLSEDIQIGKARVPNPDEIFEHIWSNL